MPDQHEAADQSARTSSLAAGGPVGRVDVTAVVVAHDGHAWLPILIRSLTASTRRPDRIIAVDTGSADSTRTDLVGAFGESSVVVTARATGFGAAVTQALDIAPPPEDPATQSWVWLLHDDCAPAPDALEAMLAQAAREPDVGILGPKIRAWPSSRRLIEVGLTLSRSGRRERGVDGAERDQGQHDAVHDVLAVNSAGMLVRRDVYDELGGFDPRIVLYGDDIDFCWRAASLGYRTAVCPRAVMHHADAATEHKRPVHASDHAQRRLSRANALYVLLVNASAARFPFRWLRLVLASVVRVLGLLVGKAPTAAWQELRALVDVLIHPRRLLAGRRQRARASRARPAVPVGSLLARPSAQARRMTAAVADLAATVGTEGGSAVAGGGRHRSAVVPAGLGGDEDEILAAERPPRPFHRLRQPFPVMMAVLLLVTVLATRHLWSTQISGGALWPAPAHASLLWSRYTEAWHTVELGSARVAPPWLAVMAALSTVSIGQTWLAVDLVLLAARPARGSDRLPGRPQSDPPAVGARLGGRGVRAPSRGDRSRRAGPSRYLARDRPHPAARVGDASRAGRRILGARLLAGGVRVGPAVGRDRVVRAGHLVGVRRRRPVRRGARPERSLAGPRRRHRRHGRRPDAAVGPDDRRRWRGPGLADALRRAGVRVERRSSGARGRRQSC